MTQYGAQFDRFAEQWRVLENLHDEKHPNRSDCGGVGGCSMMYMAHTLEEKMVDALTEWRARNPL